MMLCTDKPDLTKSSVFSLTSTTIAITAKRKMAKKKVVKNFFSMYQSSFFIAAYLTKDTGLKGWGRKKDVKAEVVHRP
jgi:hypothetical protein